MPLPRLTDKRGPLGRIRSYLLAVASLFVLVPTLLAGNVLQMGSVILLPFSRRAFRLLNRTIADSWWSLCVIVARALHGIRVEVTGNPLPAGETAIVMVNHQTMADITVLLDVTFREGRLGDLKWYVKDVLKYVPGIGWGMLFLDCLFIKRNWTADKDLIRRVFKRIKRDRVPVWITSFLEGTRMRPHKLARSQKYAAERGLPRLEHLLIPRTKGFVATLEGLRGHVDAVYDVTIGYLAGVPTLWQWTQGAAPEVHVHVRRFPVASLPEDAEALAAWVMDRYVEKDRLLDAFYREGRFALS